MTVALAIVAHPDDIEFLMAGTLIRLLRSGVEVHYWNLADGCCGSLCDNAETTAARRLREAQEAARQLGAVFHRPLVHDLEIIYEDRLLRRVASVVRQVQPDLVLTHSPQDYMEDHTNACRLAITAAFVRGMPNYLVDPPQPIQTRPVAVYHAQPYHHRDPLGALVRPDFFVDVSDLQQEKRDLLACHASQKEWLDQSQGLDSYLNTMSDLDAECGRMSGRFACAEGWRRHLPVGFGPPHFDPLAEFLREHIV